MSSCCFEIYWHQALEFLPLPSSADSLRLLYPVSPPLHLLPESIPLFWQSAQAASWDLYFWGVLVLEDAFPLASCLVDSLAGTLGSETKNLLQSAQTAAITHNQPRPSLSPYVERLLFLPSRYCLNLFQRDLLEDCHMKSQL